MLNHPAIRRFLEFPSRSSSPLNQGSETPSLAQSESESLSQQGEGAERDGEGVWRDDGSRQESRPGRNTGKVSSSEMLAKILILHPSIFKQSYISPFAPSFALGHIRCAIIHWSRAKGDLPHYRK